MALIKEVVNEESDLNKPIAQAIIKKAELSKEAYQYAIDLYKDAFKDPVSIIPFLHHNMAKGYSKIGDLEMAIFEEENALVTAKEAIKEGKFTGVINDKMIAQFEQVLAEYKQKALNQKH